MFMPLSDKLKKLTQSIHSSHSELHDNTPDVVVSAEELKLFTAPNNEAFDLAVAQLNHSLWHVEDALVGKISVAVMMSQPDLTPEQMEHALFAKQMFRAGEIRFADYLLKMQNLFPEHMDGLSDDLKEQIHQRIGNV